MLVGIGGFIFKNILVPVIMWFAFLSTVSKIGVLIGVIVFVVIMVVKLPAGATGSSDLVTDAAIRDAVKEEVKAEMKNQERKAVLENRIAACRRGIKGKQEGSWNYAHVDVNVTRKQIEKDMNVEYHLSETPSSAMSSVMRCNAISTTSRLYQIISLRQRILYLLNSTMPISL